MGFSRSEDLKHTGLMIRRRSHKGMYEAFEVFRALIVKVGSLGNGLHKDYR